MVGSFCVTLRRGHGSGCRPHSFCNNCVLQAVLESMGSVRMVCFQNDSGRINEIKPQQDLSRKVLSLQWEEIHCSPKELQELANLPRTQSGEKAEE